MYSKLHGDARYFFDDRSVSVHGKQGSAHGDVGQRKRRCGLVSNTGVWNVKGFENGKQDEVRRLKRLVIVQFFAEILQCNTLSQWHGVNI